MKNPKLAGASLAALIALVATWEGLRTTAYQDIVGIWTVCYGETKGVKKGDKYTPEQCKSKLAHEIGEYEARLNKCITRPLSDGERIALVSLSYNAGTGAVCKSTAMRLMNQGKRKEGCDALLKWSYAGGEFVQGLHNRRQAERKLCMTL